MSETTVKRTAALWVGIVFILGAALGAFGGYFVSLRVHGDNKPLTEQARRAQKVARLTQEITLSPEQQQQLDGILADVGAKYKTIHDSVEPQIDVERQKGRDRIRAILTPEQKPKFEVFLKKLDEERKRNAMQMQ